MRVLCLGSMNLDYVYSVSHILAPGETISSTGRETFAGGKGLNQSVAAAKAGLPVFHAGLSGTGGELLLETLRENGVDVSFIRPVDALPGHTVIQVDEKGQNCILLYGGTNRQLTSDLIGDVLSQFGPEDFLLLQNEVNRLDEIIDRAHARGIRIVLNPSPFDQAVMACDLDKVSLFLVNEIEGAQISGCLAREPEKILDWFGAHYPNAEVVLTLGADGAWYSGNGVRHFQPAIPVTAVDTTAAGDTFTGYFLEGWSTGRGVEETLRRATRAASIAVSRKGAAPSIPLASELAD
ncbi:MAG: ribokinase [Oscillospiraceae bacterium]|nr:ribokinase [Oscillospiraceae bacterium]